MGNTGSHTSIPARSDAAIEETEAAFAFDAIALAMVEAAPLPMMYCDRELIVRYLNPAAHESLRQQGVVPSFAPDVVVGSRLNLLHLGSRPTRQHDEDAAAARQATVTIGDRTLDLVLRDIHDARGQQMGAMATWAMARAGDGLDAPPASGTATRRSESMGSMLAEITEHATSLAGASEELTATSTQLSDGAEQTATRAALVARASERIAAGIASVAQSTEEMTVSIRQIARNAADATTVGLDAVRQVAGTNETVAKLGASSAEVGKVIKVITSIAQQTNLLALNATIEAARAGEAGRGFAVVAGEVKELARETARAADEISTKIETIQLDTAASVEAIGRIGFTIVRMNEMQTTIASAVEEQTATTRSIARSVSDVSQGTAQITEHITSTADMAQTGAAGAADTQIAARELSRLASELERLVAEFNGL